MGTYIATTRQTDKEKAIKGVGTAIFLTHAWVFFPQTNWYILCGLLTMDLLRQDVFGILPFFMNFRKYIFFHGTFTGCCLRFDTTILPVVIKKWCIDFAIKYTITSSTSSMLKQCSFYPVSHKPNVQCWNEYVGSWSSFPWFYSKEFMAIGKSICWTDAKKAWIVTFIVTTSLTQVKLWKNNYCWVSGRRVCDYYGQNPSRIARPLVYCGRAKSSTIMSWW